MTPETFHCKTCGTTRGREGVYWPNYGSIDNPWDRGRAHCAECHNIIEPPHRRAATNVTANDRLCADIGALLAREDLTGAARSLVELALRAQRGETFDLMAEFKL